MESFITSYGIYLAYFAIVVAAAGAIAFPVIQMVQNFKKAKIALVGVGIAVVLFLICWVFAKSEAFTIGEITVAESQMKILEAAMFMFYSLLAISIIAIIYSSVSRYFK
jgi:hypothetical protein